MDFDFLSKLPTSDLDDRAFQDLVDECLLRIPRYCPEWTNYNPGDPGVTMVELFAWLTDQMLMRFNQVPRRNYVAFLELLGIRLQPPAPAHTEVTFYLAASLPTVYQIAAGVEVATERTETDEAVIFSTDRPLAIGLPLVNHLLTADQAESTPTVLTNPFANLWSRRSDGRWEGREQSIFNEQPQPGNSFYLVFDGQQPLEGNVVALSLSGEAATSTGINPDHPPRQWEAWTGHQWVPVLLAEGDDQTRGFSFHELGGGADRLHTADVILHLPQQFPLALFGTYQGRWIRCVCTVPHHYQSRYSSSPRLVRVAARSIGGTIDASQCLVIHEELLGESSGLPGQSFQVHSPPVLPRREGERLLVLPPDGLPQLWQEVNDFADSGPADYHYTLDSLSGRIQLGPLIREPNQLKEQVYRRSRSQTRDSALTIEPTTTATALERQYGAVPPRGAVLRMVAYRTGGGQQGNVQRHTLQIVKSAVPYVAQVTNHVPARNGANAESLDDAVLRVPRLLRTRDRAVTPEDFEALTQQAGQGAVARALCPLNLAPTPGLVEVVVVPQANLQGIEREVGMAPSEVAITLPLRQQILAFLDERRLLGVQVALREPDYIGVAVQMEVGLAPEFQSPQAQQIVLQRLRRSLYRFLNPLTGGNEGQGWPFDTPLYASDIISLVQGSEGVRYLGTVLLFELRRQEAGWMRSLAPNNIVYPGPLGLICSWADATLRSGHVISLI
ncbi:putative baseplate assembly protein [Nodosilinea sp. E11]|uniref:putative baseplate assembly protein n=1 Tax=Nodosilinea sp. E11 TaxID=3037479 RepID=UPI0029351810|nr:putative baseplate assembly protein [Nodosilinea sp. E11]WOD37091.1 putative baseplate assembly protein [Nodosilinea sp. E11]